MPTAKELLAEKEAKGVITVRAELSVQAVKADGRKVEFKVQALLNTPVELNYYRNGGILHTVLRNLIR